jgi:regulator of protease activity HflC (stomatin/prohibitin superfamily)
MLDSGIHFLKPFVDQITFTRCLKTGLLDCPPQVSAAFLSNIQICSAVHVPEKHVKFFVQHVITKDNVSIAVDGAVTLLVVDTYKSCYEAVNPAEMIIAMANGIIRKIVRLCFSF